MKTKILSRQALEELAKEPFAPNTAVISITDSDAGDVRLRHAPDALLRLKFDDVSAGIFTQCLGRKPSVMEMRQLERRFRMLSQGQARQIAEFVLKNTEKNLLCQCEHGESRSAAVAAAVEEFFHRRGVTVFADERYYPNKWVYRLVLLALRNRKTASVQNNGQLTAYNDATTK